MLVSQIVMFLIGISAGFLVSGGLFGFITSLGVLTDFAERTKTKDKVPLYEGAVALGGICGNLIFTYQISLHISGFFISVLGLAAGIFVGAWAMALAEMIQVFPVLLQKGNLYKYVKYLILAIAIGKGIGSVVYFWMEW